MEALTVISLPEVPLTLKLLVIVVVVAEVRVRVRALVTSEKLMVPKVLEPVMTSAPVDPATVYVSVPYVQLPPWKERLLADAAEITMVDVPVMVTLVFEYHIWVKSPPFTVEVSVMVLEPRANVETCVAKPSKMAHVTLLLLVVSPPVR